MKTDGQNSGKELIARVSFFGREEGPVKRFPDFDKSRHTAPKFASDRAQQFLARLAEPELNEWGEERFSAFRESMRYRRKEIALVVEGGTGRIESKDFTIEKRYSLVEGSPDRYLAETELLEASSSSLLEDTYRSMGPWDYPSACTHSNAYRKRECGFPPVLEKRISGRNR